MQLGRASSGDTLIEVLFAVAVFSLVAVGCLSIMNQGAATAERSLEVTLVRQQMDAQVASLRYIHQSYVANYHKNATPTAGPAFEWTKMTDRTISGNKAASNASVFATDMATCPTATPGEKPFILNARKATIWSSVPSMAAPSGGSLPPFAQVVYNSSSNITNAYGIWIESVPSAASTHAGYVDFHVRACWNAPGSSVASTLGTIVRLYEPRS